MSICSGRLSLQKPPSREEEFPPADAGDEPVNGAGAMAVPSRSDRFHLLPPQAPEEVGGEPPPSVPEEPPEDNEPAAQLGPTTKGWAGQVHAASVMLLLYASHCNLTLLLTRRLAACSLGHGRSVPEPVPGRCFHKRWRRRNR